MATGLFALLDDVAAIAKVAAASLDDIGAASMKAGVKAAGVVIDDAAVTPRYVTGFAAARELPIVGKIALGSIRNKLLYLLPTALVLSELAPWAITPLLMAGGAYLCFEGAEKLHDAFVPHVDDEDVVAAVVADDVEQTMVAGAIRTDLILSGEIMAITLASVSAESFVERAVILTLVGVAITVGVYGAVALIVKADDLGIFLARQRFGFARLIGRALVGGMPTFLKSLAAIGTAAMLWVGGGIVLHGLETYGLAAPQHWLHGVSLSAGRNAGRAAEWAIGVAGSGLFGMLVGGIIVGGLHVFKR